MSDCIELRRKIPLLKGFIDEENKKFRAELTEKENIIRDMEDEDQEENEEQDKERIKHLKGSIEAIETKRMYLANAKRQLDKTSFKNNIITECRDVFSGTINEINELNNDTDDVLIPGCQNTQSPITLFVKHLITKDKEYEKGKIRAIISLRYL